MVTITSADKALKSLYLGVVADQLNTEVNPFFNEIKKTTQDVVGKEVKKVARFGVNGGIGAGTEDGNLPIAVGNNYEQLTSTLKNLYGPIEISDKAIRASANDAGAFVNLLDDEMDGLIKASQFNFGRMLFGDGTGICGRITAVSGNVLTVNNVKNLATGMVVDVIDSSEAVRAISPRKITDIDRANKKVTLGGATLSAGDVVSGDYLIVQNSYKQEITGLGAIFKTTGSIYGLDRSTHKWLVPYIKSSVGTITETEIQKTIDTLEEETGSKINFILCSAGVKRALQQVLSAYRRNCDVMELKGGYKAMSYNGIPVVSDRFCPDGTMYFLNTDDFAGRNHLQIRKEG
ncbi:MAG: phage major capsid protein, partial [Clostridia bacterium]|nr:phage major capsid protein [Clostridia bacterium]